MLTNVVTHEPYCKVLPRCLNVKLAVGLYHLKLNFYTQLQTKNITEICIHHLIRPNKLQTQVN